MRQASRGFLRLQSNDPSQHPIIEPNYLSTDIGISVMCLWAGCQDSTTEILITSKNSLHSSEDLG